MAIHWVLGVHSNVLVSLLCHPIHFVMLFICFIYFFMVIDYLIVLLFQVQSIPLYYYTDHLLHIKETISCYMQRNL